MKKAFFFLALILPAILSAQEPGVDPQDFPKNAVFVEAGGTAYIYSVNYARYYRSERFAASARLGVSYLRYNNTFSMPLEGTAMFGGKRHFLELGLGLIFFSKSSKHHMSPGGASMGLSDYYTHEKGVNASPRIGYCFLPLRSHRLMCKVAYTPVFFSARYALYGDIYPEQEFLWGGISLGYAF